MPDNIPPEIPQPEKPSPATESTPPPKKSSQYVDPDYCPIEGEDLSNVLNHLLKKPLSVIHGVQHGKDNLLPILLIITVVSLGIFGLVLGLFSTGNQLWAAPVKVIGGVLFSGLICLPSLYIFGALGGMTARVRDIVGLMLTFLSITSLLLVGFAPIVWLFSTSSNSLVFFGFLSLGIWTVCLIFGLRLIARASKSMGSRHASHLNIWALIFILVTVQMTTTLRPIIGTSEDFLNLTEKKFFLIHWGEMMNKETSTLIDSPQKKQTDSEISSPNKSDTKPTRRTNPYLNE